MLNHKWLGEQHPKTFFRWPKYKLSALHSNEVWMEEEEAPWSFDGFWGQVTYSSKVYKTLRFYSLVHVSSYS